MTPMTHLCDKGLDRSIEQCKRVTAVPLSILVSEILKTGIHNQLEGRASGFRPYIGCQMSEDRCHGELAVPSGRPIRGGKVVDEVIVSDISMCRCTLRVQAEQLAVCRAIALFAHVGGCTRG
jgi:hypothetical protein